MRLSISRATCPSAVLAAFAIFIAAPVSAQEKAAQVVVDKVIEEPLRQTMPVLGRFVARRSGPVAALASGPVEETLVEVGDRVSKGDVLARLSTDISGGNRDLRLAELREQEAKLETARAELRLADLELRRLENLKKSPAFSQAKYEDKAAEAARLKSKVAEAAAAVVYAKANLALATLTVERAEIRAPYNGVVVTRHVEVGAYINTGAPVVDLVNDEDMEIEADVPSDRLSGLTPDRPVRVTFDNGLTAMAVVRSVIPTENALTRTRPVRFTVQSADTKGLHLATDESATILIPIGEPRDVVSVHKDAVIARGGDDIVFLVVDGKAQVRPVKLGQAVGGRIEVVSGLAPDDIVVIRGNERLRPGQDVRYKGMPLSGGDG